MSNRLTAVQAEQITQMLPDLLAVRKDLAPNAAKFIDDQISRFDKYGNGMFMSLAQWNWLVGLYEKHVAPLNSIPVTYDPYADRKDTLGDDTDDDIPF